MRDVRAWQVGNGSREGILVTYRGTDYVTKPAKNKWEPDFSLQRKGSFI